MGWGWYDDDQRYHKPDPLPSWALVLIGVAVGIALGYLLFVPGP